MFVFLSLFPLDFARGIKGARDTVFARWIGADYILLDMDERGTREQGGKGARNVDRYNRVEGLWTRP